MQGVMIGWEILRRLARKAGPYVMLEMLLPGGTLLALLLFMYRRRELLGRSARRLWWRLGGRLQAAPIKALSRRDGATSGIREPSMRARVGTGSLLSYPGAGGARRGAEAIVGASTRRFAPCRAAGDARLWRTLAQASIAGRADRLHSRTAFQRP